jgi:hypothetical protein
MSLLSFEPLYYAEKLDLVNTTGDVGVIVLWTPMKAARRKLAEMSPDILDPLRSRVAVIANLYGDGMYAMFCNLLHNPQIRHLISVGEDLGLPTCREIEAFLADGLESATMLGRRVQRIRGTRRFFPDLEEFDDERLRRTLTFSHLGKFSSPEAGPAMRRRLAELPRAAASPPERIRVPPSGPDSGKSDSGKYVYRPSQVTAHQVMRERPLDCWEELVVRTVRFGRPVSLADGPRLELLNAKVVISRPEADAEDALARYGFDLGQFEEYQKRILSAELPDNISYTYGNRLRGYFGSRPDTLEHVASAFLADPETRHGYISLWDTFVDLPQNGSERPDSRPCLTTLFFRLTEGALSLTATYRSHNLLTAWLENVYGLMAIQRHVAERVGIPVGPVTVVSYSLGIDPRNHRYQLALAMAEEWKRDDDFDHATGKPALRRDPNGYFEISVDHEAGRIIAEHRVDGLLIKRYSADRAQKIEREIAGDMAVSLVSHALWLGRELAMKEHALRDRMMRSSA